MRHNILKVNLTTVHTENQTFFLIMKSNAQGANMFTWKYSNDTH